MVINLCASVTTMVFKLSIFSVLVNVCSVLLIVWSLGMLRGMNKEYYVRIWAWITGLTAVKIMDFTHEVRYTLVESQSDGTWTGPVHFHLNAGQIKLWPNGHVDSKSECSFCYIWHPLDQDLMTQLQLTHWEHWPDWSTWLEKTHLDMVTYRSRILNT